MIKLSICIPTYNRYEKVAKIIRFFCSEGVNQFSNIELIVSDNASSQHEVNKLVSLCKQKEIFLNLNKVNMGLIGNINKLTELAVGEYIWYVGDDDELKPGILKKVHDIILQYDIGHLFINHSATRDGEIINSRLYDGVGGYYSDGLKMFRELTEKSFSNLGVQMFITANIFKRKFIKEADLLAISLNEYNNLALPLGYALFSSVEPGYIIDEVMINNDWTETSWSDKSILVHCRDMFAICDGFSTYMQCGKIIRPLLLSNLPCEYPEFVYLKHQKKFKKDNYVMKFYLTHCPHRSIKDVALIIFNKYIKRFMSFVKNKN